MTDDMEKDPEKGFPICHKDVASVPWSQWSVYGKRVQIELLDLDQLVSKHVQK